MRLPRAIASPPYDPALTPHPVSVELGRVRVNKKTIAPTSTLEGRSLTFWNLILLCLVSHYT
ncbi:MULTISPECIES: hypothetical protein [Trichocoleus]|uniref:Uncharacterized protein n=1 Tax=Trichocoleus desertorum GB2-A4 TaxID=2933944 RepID=A0ABV0JHR2_9CYAN|nr:hypothetical protein [Trichocoleus sp. FACHB-46]MBD1863044.1 hypothetical protein [Trichocoleus sp. FACHB-46]